MANVRLPGWYYQQFDADYSLDVPAEGYGSWQQEQVELSLEHTAVVVMHAWSAGTREQFPGWYRAVEYLERSNRICRDVFPPLLSAVRGAGLPVLHVVGGGEYYKDLPGYRKAVELAGARTEPAPPPVKVHADPTAKAIRKLYAKVFPGEHNQADCRRGFEQVDFPPEAMPMGQEGVAEDTAQLLALCLDGKINHLVYVGFAINFCLAFSPGGMVDMGRHGLICSTIRQAVTAVERRETARGELAKEQALWQVPLLFGGLVFDLDDVVGAMAGASRSPSA